jgi:hypothetical protein
MTVLFLLLPDGRAYHGRFLGDDRPFLRGGLAGANLPDEIAELERHIILYSRGGWLCFGRIIFARLLIVKASSLSSRLFPFSSAIC